MVVNHDCVGWMLHQKPALLSKRRKPFLNKTWEWGTEVALSVKPVFDLKWKTRLRRDQLVPLRKTVTCFSFTVYMKHRDLLAEWHPWSCTDTMTQCRKGDLWSAFLMIQLLKPFLCVSYIPIFASHTFLTLKSIPWRNSSLQIPSSPIPPASSVSK